jgi:hypothetical protein
MMRAFVPRIDCLTCRDWAFHCARDLMPVHALGRWHHPSHADDLLDERRRAERAHGAVRMPSGEVIPVEMDAGGQAGGRDR